MSRVTEGRSECYCVDWRPSLCSIAWADHCLTGRLFLISCTHPRLFYLSISPDFYGWVAAAIDQHARPQVPAWLRVVFEKPFGRVGQVDLRPGTPVTLEH